MTIDAPLVQLLRRRSIQGALDSVSARSPPSVTGEETAFALMLAEELRRSGREGSPSRILRRAAQMSRGLKAATPGPRLLLTGHTDTVHVRGWPERWAGTERETRSAARIVDGALWGRGAGDLKAGLCTTIEAVRLLDRAGLPLAGRSPSPSSATRKAASLAAGSAPA